jgi:hypothetical protein
MDRTLYPSTANRRTRLWLLLPLLLVLSQQGAWLHELSHATYAAHAHHALVQQQDAAADNGVCPSCQSFGQLGTALAGSLATPAAAITRSSPQTDPQYAQPSAPPPALRNRGPPRPA